MSSTNDNVLAAGGNEQRPLFEGSVHQRQAIVAFSAGDVVLRALSSICWVLRFKGLVEPAAVYGYGIVIFPIRASSIRLGKENKFHCKVSMR